MFSASVLRSVCSSRALLLHRNRLTTNRQPCFGAVTRPAHCTSTGFSQRDAALSNTRLTACGRETQPVCYADSLTSLRSYCTSGVKRSCWNCKETHDKTPTFFCLSCKLVQPPEEGTSFFKIMDCDRTFALDTQKLQRQYLQLQRSLHPDNFSQKSAKEQEYSEHQSALVNKAYTTLLKPLTRGLYMLELEGMRIEEGTDSGADSAFLMELMEINEALDEAQTPEEANRIGQDTKGKLAGLTVEIDAALRKGELQAAKALLAQMKYFANIEEKVKEKLSEFM